MQVALVYQNKTHSDIRWSLFNHQGNDWLTAEVAFNLQAFTQFQIQFQVKEIHSTKADVYLDDILLTNCGKYIPTIIDVC